MNLDYAIDRLYQSGWIPGVDRDLYQTLPDGRKIPATRAIEREFARAGLELRIKHNLVFDCYRASWQPVQQSEEQTGPGSLDLRHGTVVAESETEAAIFALAQYRELQVLRGATTT